jgi:PAS domain S-box-containing protein
MASSRTPRFGSPATWLAELEAVARIGSYSVDIRTGRWESSQGLDSIFGIGPDHPRTLEGWAALIHPDDRAAMVAYFADDVVGRGVPFDRRYRITRVDTGAAGWVHGRGALDRDASGRVVRMFGTIADVTDQLAAAEERARLAAAVDHTSDSVAITDLDGAIEYVNPAFEAMSGYRADDVIGQNPRILKSGRQGVGFYRAMWRRLARGSAWSGRFLNRRADGTLYEVEATISPIRGADGVVNGYVGVERDVTALQAARSSLANEFRERAQVAAALARLQPAGSVEETAAEICDELMGLPSVDLAEIVTLLAPGQAVTLAVRGPDGLPMAPGRPLPADRAAYLFERAGQGPWSEAWPARAGDGGHSREIARAGIRAMAYAPIRNGKGLLGVVAAGTRDPAYVDHMIDHLPAVGEFAATASALLAGHLESGRRISERRASIERVIATRAFRPVFQPIVDVRSGETVAYEALTRFTDGTPPDITFAEAWAVDLGRELELATLEAAIAAARGLPKARWLEVNVSPRLLAEADRLRPVLARADRRLVVEVTEHETVADYKALRSAIDALGDDVQTAVDDAGAGIANFAHIVELRPRYVKLDISLIRGVDADVGRQALVAAMRHFGQATACRLIAEGVETREEALTIEALGVELGQGYWYGRPEPVAVASRGRARAAAKPVSA